MLCHREPVEGRGAIVYRLGHRPFKAERRVRFPLALPTWTSDLSTSAASLRSSFRAIVQNDRLGKSAYVADRVEPRSVSDLGSSPGRSRVASSQNNNASILASIFLPARGL